MPTGACGINCETCRLHRRGVCGSCGGGTSDIGGYKIKIQEKLLGAPCPILACARLNRIDYCLGDCDTFPCENFVSSTYPFGEGFLNMHKRRRGELEEKTIKDTTEVPEAHWQRLRELTVSDLQRRAGASVVDDFLQLTVLEKNVRIDPAGRTVETREEGRWVGCSRLLALVSLVYLINAKGTPLSGEWVSEKDLRCASFFRGIHQLPLDPLLEKFGDDQQAFIEAGKKIGAVEVEDPGDAAIRFWAFPFVPLKMSLWCRDTELPASISVLCDKSIEDYLPADGIWALVRLISEFL